MTENKHLDVPYQAHREIEYSISRYNHSLAYLSNSWLPSILILSIATTTSCIFAYTSDSVAILVGWFCATLTVILCWLHFSSDFCKPQFIQDNPRMAAFHASFHGERKKDLSTISLDSQLWTALCERHNERVQKMLHASREFYLHAMIRDGIMSLC